MIISFGFMLCILFFALFMWFRNNWVYNRRTELNRFVDGKHLIKKYISYDAMMLRFWVWDIEKLKIKSIKSIKEIKP